MTTQLVSPPLSKGIRKGVADNRPMSCQKHADETFLYRHQSGSLRLSDTPLHTDGDQWCLCNEGKGEVTVYVGSFELIASGPHKEMAGLAHTMILGLDNPMRGI
ncbi:MAG: hypothetical protein AAGC93_29370 [Cyanobacteria bacterium P01_F01_bin.53]